MPPVSPIVVGISAILYIGALVYLHHNGYTLDDLNGTIENLISVYTK
jgi:hypothetical protein